MKKKFKIAVAFLLSIMIVLMTSSPETALSAYDVINSSITTLIDEGTSSGSNVVFISDLVGYAFFVSSTGTGVYASTTDGGTTWSATTPAFDPKTVVVGINVWYDRWTPGDNTGNYIHILSWDTSADDMFYNRLDTSTNGLVLVTAVDISTNSSNSIATIVAGANYASITKSATGTLYAALYDVADSYMVQCSNSCNTAGGWTEPAAWPFSNSNNHNPLLQPLNDGDVMMIRRDITADDIYSNVWDGGSRTWSATTTIDANTPENTTYDVNLSAVTIASTTAATTTTWLVYTSDNATLGTDDDIRFAKYQTDWATTTNLLTNTTRGVTGAVLAVSTTTRDLHVISTEGVAASSSVYWYTASSTNLSSWTARGIIEATSTNKRGLSSNYFSGERLYATWMDDIQFDQSGITVFDIPAALVAAVLDTGREIWFD